MVSVEIIIKKLPRKLKEDWESGKFSFIDFIANELNIPQKDIEAGYGEGV